MRKIIGFKFFIFSTLQFIFFLTVNGQVKGKILDGSGKVLPFCQVALVRPADTTIISTSLTNENGEFIIQLKDSGTFRILVSYMGFSNYYSKIFSISLISKVYEIGNIVLEPDNKTLKTVQVIAQKPLVEYQSDRTVYNIENSIISAGNNALEVLKKLPGVNVDNNDNISVNGQSGALIMIDGRTSYLSAADAAAYLRNMDASQIEKIEVITNPSSKYDASGNTVINIVRKKNKNPGINLELTSGYAQGIYGGGNEGVNVNYSKNKWNLYANYGYTFSKFYSGYGGITRFVSNNAVQSIFADSLQRRQLNLGNNGRFEADFSANKKQTIGFIFEGMQADGSVDKNSPSYMENADSRLDSSLTLLGHRIYNVKNITFGLNYDFKIDSTGKDLSADIDYATYSNTFNETDITNYFDSLGNGTHPPTILQYTLPKTINILAAKIDFNEPIGKTGSFEAGLKNSFVTTSNNAQYWNIKNGEPFVDTTFTNNFNYSEYIYAGYLSYAQNISKKSYFKFGLRGEATQGKGVQVVHDTTFTHTYFNLFPTALFTYKLDTNNTLKLFFRRRIWRPDYQDLNPFVYFVNPYSYQEGNPALQPQISNAGYIGEQFKQLLEISAGDEYWTNPINDNVIQNNITHITYTIPVNYKNYNNSYAKIESTIPVKKWFTSMNTLLFMRQRWQGVVQGVNFTNTGFTWTYNSVNTITITKNWSGEVDFNYSSQQVNGPEDINPVYVAGAGIKWRFAHDSGTISLNCSDIFLSDRYLYSENFQGENFNNYYFYDSRKVRLTLSWKIGKSENERKEKDKASEEETDRVKG